MPKSEAFSDMLASTGIRTWFGPRIRAVVAGSIEGSLAELAIVSHGTPNVSYPAHAEGRLMYKSADRDSQNGNPG